MKVEKEKKRKEREGEKERESKRESKREKKKESVLKLNLRTVKQWLRWGRTKLDTGRRTTSSGQAGTWRTR